MRSLTAKSRITIGLACLLVSVLGTAIMLGLVPDRRSAVLDGRAALCETLAVSASDYVSRGELRRLEFLVQSVLERNDDVLSAGVRKADGSLVAQFGDHEVQWRKEAGDRSSSTHVLVPIRSGQDKWGAVELRFRQLRQVGILGWITGPWCRLVLFVACASYLLFFVYLGKMLEHLDPSKTVPRRVRAALDSLAEGLMVVDKSGRIVLANQALAGWVDRDADKLIGVKAAALDWARDEGGQPPEIYPWDEALRLETPQAGRMIGLKDVNDKLRALMTNASPVLGHDGKYRGVLVSFDDVTQLEETRRNLDEAKQVAEDANRTKSEFLARMSHEIRTPMNAILGYTDVLRRGFDESAEDRQEYLDTIHASGEHLLALINDILDLSKIESGRMELELGRVSPQHLIGQVVSVLRMKAEEKGIGLAFECPGPLPETILTDPVRLRQAIINLVGNAIKFTEQGGVRVVGRIENNHETGGGPEGPARHPMLVIDVIDTGIGIEPESLESIFNPFAQADTSITRRFGGTGLGLAISQQLAKAMGGDVTAISEPGRGSTFTIAVDPGPLEGVPLVDANVACTEAQQRAASQEQTPHLPPARVLVADDGDSNRKLVRLVLTRAGCQVDEADNGQDAARMALLEPYDVILMDMQMPVMDGYMATSTLREAGYEGPIVALTAHAMQGDQEKCYASGCSGFLTKPVKLDRLLDTLAELLSPNDSVCQVGHQEPRTATAGGSTQSTGSAALPSIVHAEPDQSVAKAAGEFDDSTPFGTASPDADKLAASQPKVGDLPIRCSLPLEDPEFREIAEEFVGRLHEKLHQARRTWADGDFEELARFGHWLKGSGGTAGFQELTDAGRELEQAAKAGHGDTAGALLAGLAAMIGRIELETDEGPQTLLPCRTSVTAPPAEATNDVGCSDPGHEDKPLRSSLPVEDPDFLAIVEEFAVRLEEQLAAMERALLSQDYDELAALAHWLKGSGGTAGFDAFTVPARTLESLARQQQRGQIPDAIAELRRLARRIDTAPVTVS